MPSRRSPSRPPRPRALRRVGQQHRIGVVDVDEDAAADGEPGEALRSSRPRPAMLICPMRRPVLAPTPVRRHLVVGPGGAVEEHAASAPVEAGRQRRPASPRSRARRRSVRPLAASVTCRPMLSSATLSRSRRASRPPARAPPCPGLRTAVTARPAGPPPGSMQLGLRLQGQRRRGPPPRVQHAEDRVGGEHPMHPRRGVEAQRLTLPQAQQAGNVIDVGVGQHHARHRAVPQTVRRMQRGRLRRVCCRMSGEAFSRNQFAPSALTATDDCVRGRPPDHPLGPVGSTGQLQFHCGKPPPAADPRTMILTSGPPGLAGCGRTRCLVSPRQAVAHA